eukprot:TRINITY_DN1670_c0_g1_i1.p1 TRINITY_DN1670_c0_g1~~TRINITY_DN1670_c0_g1_i1.p1  ORF type:complete len:360 (-),score=64.01 TRINITY_DN1670_c0_g1_i1:510-1589(-)
MRGWNWLYSLAKFLASRAKALLDDDFVESDRLWLTLDSPIDLVFGPYETYDDNLRGYKATYESLVGIRDDEATAKVKLFSDHLQELEDNLPEPEEYKGEVRGASLTRVVKLVSMAGAVNVPPLSVNLPNDVRTTSLYGQASVCFSNVLVAKFNFMLQPIADVLISSEQRADVSYDAFYMHNLCYELCANIGPSEILLPDGTPSNVRKELQAAFSPLEVAKAAAVGLWSVQYFMDKGLVSSDLSRGFYVSFLANCFRAVRHGTKEAHGMGQAMQIDWLLQHGAFIFNEEDGTFAVNFDMIQEAVCELSRTLLTIQGQGNKAAAEALIEEYCVISAPVEEAISRLAQLNIPVALVANFPLG